MSIRPDKWIRRMCEQHDMISPFEPELVRVTQPRSTITFMGTEWSACQETRDLHQKFYTENLRVYHPVTGEALEPLTLKQLIALIDRQLMKNAHPEKAISYGTSSYGYDIRCADEFKVFTNINSTIVDPKNFNDNNFVDFSGQGCCIIPPNSFALGRSVERFKIPRNVLTVCLGKSTYARCGIIVNVTPFEPEWEGYVTLEFSNTTPLPAKIYANEGVAQVLFFESDEECETSYKDRGGKYQNQPANVVLPKT